MKPHHATRATLLSTITGLSAGFTAYNLTNSWSVAIGTGVTASGVLDTLNRSSRLLAAAIDRNTQAQIDPEKIPPNSLDL